jgi:hypothetical protein
MFMPVPVANVLFHSENALYFVPLLLVPVLLISRGMICLLLPDRATKRPFAIPLGGIAVLALLGVAPFSLKVAWLNRELEPFWLFFWGAGTIVLLAYVYLVFLYWRRAPSAT